MESDYWIYRKIGRKYVKVGISCQNEIPMGIYYVRKHKYSKYTTSCDYMASILKLGDPEVLNLPKLCSIWDYSQYLMQHPKFKELMNEWQTKGMCLQDVIMNIVHLIATKNTEINKQIQDNYDDNKRTEGHS